MGLGIASTLCVLALLSALPDRAQSPAIAARNLPPGYDGFVHELDALQTTLLPALREQRLESMRQHTGTLLQPLLWQLSQPKDQRFAGAAAMAAELDLSECVPLLSAALTGSVPRARGPALRALDRLQPLSDGELVALAADAALDEALAMAWLDVTSARTTPSPELLAATLGFLGAASPQVRARALASLPTALPQACMAPLLALADDPVAGTAALPLLDRCPSTPETVQALMDRLATAEPEAQAQCVANLEHFAEQESVRALLQRTALGDGPTANRVAALTALERVRDTLTLPDTWTQWPARLRYHAARLCIATGRIEGIPMLIALADENGEPDEDRATAAMARYDLSQMAHVAPHTKVAYYREWFSTLTESPPHALPPVRNR
jgi:hypothetical protein